MLCVNFRLVIETLRDVDDDRRCFRLVGGVLVERTVKDVLPALVNNKDQVSVYYATNFGKVEGAYCFRLGPMRRFF